MYFFESFVVWILCQLCSVIQAQNCIRIQDCVPPQKCCINLGKCCYVPQEADNENLNGDNSYSFYGRLNVWNMWYFWFIVLFILITCFGICGYWRRRQFILSGHHRQALTSHSIRSARMGLVPDTSSYLQPHNFMSSLISGNLARDYVQPPPYSEVASKPSTYPVSDNAMKDDLPPYPYEEYQYYMSDDISPSAENEPDASQETKTDDVTTGEGSTEFTQNQTQVMLPLDPPPYPGSETEPQSRT